MTQKERMLAGLPYKAWLDGLSEERMACRRKLHAFNLLPPDEEEQAQRLLLELLGKTGRDPWINAPFHCDYGWNIEVGDNFFANYNLTIMDVGKVTIGSNVQFAPNVSIYTAGHPLPPDSRLHVVQLMVVGGKQCLGVERTVFMDMLHDSPGY